MNIFQYMKNPLTGNKLLSYAREVVAENELVIKDIQESQWDKGEDKFGSVIGRYKEATKYKSKQIPRPNRRKETGSSYNLDWSGDLRRKTDVKTERVGNDIKVITNSTSSNLPELLDTIRKHGLIKNPNSIFGYQEKNLKRIKDVIGKELKIIIKKRHGL